MPLPKLQGENNERKQILLAVELGRHGAWHGRPVAGDCLFDRKNRMNGLGVLMSLIGIFIALEVGMIVLAIRRDDD